MEELKFIIFKLGEQKYAMNLLYINGIEQNYQIIPVPNAPEGIEGIINLRGDVIPVYSLKQRFGMDTRVAGTDKNLLVTMSSGTAVAYEVDEVFSIEELDKEKILNMPQVVSSEETSFMEQVLHVGDDIVIVIDIDKVLSEDMREKVNQIIENNK